MKPRLFLLALISSVGLASASADTADIPVSAVKTEGNVSVTEFVNDATYPWLYADGDSIVSSEIKGNYTTSSLTFKFTSEEPVVLTFNYMNGGSVYDGLYAYVDGSTSKTVDISGASGSYKTGSSLVYFNPGEHSVKFTFYRYYQSYSGINNAASIKNIKLVTPESQYMSIDLSAPGTLGVEALSLVNTLPEMRYLRLSGKMNSDDWAQLKNMTGLRALDMTNVDITEIPASAFTNNSFRYFSFPKTLKKIGEKAFYDRYLMSKVELPEGLESIGAYAFYNNNITNVTLPSTLTEVGNYVFSQNDKLTTFTFGGGFKAIPQGFLYDCDALVTVNGLDSIVTVGIDAFNGCNVLADANGLQPKYVYNGAFAACNALKDFDMSKLSLIGNYAFEYCYALTKAELPSLTSWNSDNGQFYQCRGLETVVLPDNITTVPSSAFYDCSSLKNITLGASMTTLGSNCFNSSNAKIQNIYCNAPTPPSVSSPFYTTGGIKLYVPEYSMVSYKLDSYWSRFTTVEPNPNKVSNITLSSALELTSNTRIPDTPDVLMNNNSSLTVNGSNAQVIGNFTGYYSITQGATIISRTPAMTSLSSEARYYLGGSSYWYFLCMPFDVNMSDITTSNGAQVAIRYYDSASRAENGTGSSWKNMPSDGVLRAGQGYIFCSSASCYIYLRATDETHNRIFTSEALKTTLNEYPSETTSNKNWNLVGNPYSAYYDIYYMDYTAPITVWSTDNKTYTAYSVADDELVLTPLQAFFVQKPDLVSDITFQTSGRQTSKTIDHSALLAPARAVKSQRQVINLTLSDGTVSDQTRIVVNPQRSDAYETDCDAAKMMSYDGTPQLYSISNGEQYAINEGAHHTAAINLGFWVAEAGSYTIDVTRADASVQLYDNGEAVAMPYTFTAKSETTEGRFVLKLTGTTDGIENIISTESNDAIYNLAGQRVTRAAKGVKIQNGKKVF